MKKIIARAKAPTPRFFKKIKTIGIVVAAVGSAVLASPVVLPTAVISIAGYLLLAGSVMGAVSQLTVSEEQEPE